jgi:hypothetical protein
MQSDVSVPNIYGTSSSTYLIIFLKVISKVLFFNITQKFTNLLVQLSIFLIYLFVGTYRLSSHARLEAFVIQTKLKTTCNQITTNIIQMRRDIEHNPHKYLSNASMGVQASASGMQASASQPPNPYRAKGLSSFVLQVAGMLRVPASIGWCRTQNIHSYIMPVVFTLSTFFFLCLFDTLIRRPDHVITITTHHF